MEWSPKDSLATFSKLERGAIIILLLFIAIGGSSGYWLPSVWPKAEHSIEIDRLAFREEIAAWEDRNQLLVDSLTKLKLERDRRYADNRKQWNKPKWNTSPKNRDWPKRKAETVSIDYSIPMPALASVDANAVDTNVLFRMGVPPKIARRWVKFRDRGGSFVRKEDVGKLYGMPDSTLARILPFIKKPNLKDRRTIHRNIKRTDLVPDINTATSEELQKVRGIGPFFADRIIEYRTQLGGFLSLDQLSETPGFRDSTYLKLRDKLKFVPREPRLIRINQVDQNTLAAHPYITQKQAEIVILNRRNHGNYSSKEDLLETIVLDEETVNRLMPYVDFVE